MRRAANALGYDIVGFDGQNNRWRLEPACRVGGEICLEKLVSPDGIEPSTL
jgi:hypothetical protein